MRPKPEPVCVTTRGWVVPRRAALVIAQRRRVALQVLKDTREAGLTAKSPVRVILESIEAYLLRGGYTPLSQKQMHVLQQHCRFHCAVAQCGKIAAVVVSLTGHCEFHRSRAVARLDRRTAHRDRKGRAIEADRKVNDSAALAQKSMRGLKQTRK